MTIAPIEPNHPNDDMTLGTKIETLRKLRGLSQQDIATACDLSQGAVSFWCRDVNVPSVTHAIILARLFDVPIGYLLTDSDDRTVDQLKDELDVRQIAERFGWRFIYDRVIGAPSQPNPATSGWTNTGRNPDPEIRRKDEPAPPAKGKGRNHRNPVG